MDVENEHTPAGIPDFRTLIERSDRLLEESRQVERSARRASRRFHDLDQRLRLVLEQITHIDGQASHKWPALGTLH